MLGFKLVLLILFISRSSANDEETTENYPMENPDMLEGDIIDFDYADERNAVVNNNNLWPGGKVPFVIDRGISKPASISLVRSAMKHYENKTCIRFVPRSNQTNYLRIFPGQGCYSRIGKSTGAHPLSLGQGCFFLGTIIHELGHAIGFHHEHNRSDRDMFVNILWDNIKPGQESQFTKLKPDMNRLLTPFDYDSIMLYGSYTFSKDRSKLRTIVKKNGGTIKNVVQKRFLSPSDILRIKKLYHC